LVAANQVEDKTLPETPAETEEESSLSENESLDDIRELLEKINVDHLQL
jgi:hypothetical protein